MSWSKSRVWKKIVNKKRKCFVNRGHGFSYVQLQSWPKCVGQSASFPNCCNIRSVPPSPPMQCWTTRRQAFPYEEHCMGGGGEGRIWPKERLFPCEKLIDGRGSAFCKLVPHNFGQDCSFRACHLEMKCQMKKKTVEKRKWPEAIQLVILRAMSWEYHLARALPSYKNKTCIGGWPNGTAKSSHLARKPFNCLTTTAQSPNNNNLTTQWELAEVAKRWNTLCLSWKIWAWSNSSQLQPTRTKCVAERYPTPSKLKIWL